MSQIIKKTQYFLGEQQVISAGKALARELGISETTLRSWVESPQFPLAIHTEVTHGGGIVKYYPYHSAVKFIGEKMEEYKVNRAKGIGRPSKVKTS